ncbi:response regulator [Sandarakinorhabdus oryzae]|uniref:response regulator n=1 Tax=Sandarakinorhabdus oryzae TaxID=2675220 RepID=UPI0012E17885|nr:response regulator [Sandarakinorhabdus oryzae]
MTLATRLAAHLPYLRRYARALTGSQEAGDGLVAATLEAVVGDRALLPASLPPRLALFAAFHAVWAAETSPSPPGPADDRLPARMASARLAAITPRSRQALLLGAMEGFADPDIATLIGCAVADVPALIADALAQIARMTRSRVLIIEDEPIIAMDIESIVTGLGHGVIGIAATRAQALELVAAEPPGLVLADIQLRDGSSGIDAVRHILARQAVPVIFITGFPERLLTGERPEPTFLITKPFQAGQVQAAIAQALFFNSTAALHE